MTIAPRELDHLPVRPGVYMLKDGDGDVLYIGKANALRARVRSYFRPDRAQSLRTRELARRTAAVETIVVGSGAEALILEANLIKEYRPRFNIQLRDDKSYPHIKVTVAEPFPRVFVTRRLRQDGSRYFGPYTSVGLMRQSLEVVKRLYTVRSCRYRLPEGISGASLPGLPHRAVPGPLRGVAEPAGLSRDDRRDPARAGGRYRVRANPRGGAHAGGRRGAGLRGCRKAPQRAPGAGCAEPSPAGLPPGRRRSGCDRAGPRR